MSPEAERLAKKARKKERKAARLAEAQRQAELGGGVAEQQREIKKRKRKNSDADVQSLLVPSQPPPAPSQKRKETAIAAEPAPQSSEEASTVDASRKKKKRKQNVIEENELVAPPAPIASTETVEERKKRKREKRRSDAATSETLAGTPLKEAVATTDAEERSLKKSKEAKMRAGVKTSTVGPLPASDARPSSPSQGAESPAARSARKAEKKARKERKRSKAEAAARKTTEEASPQRPEASTSMLAKPAKRASFAEEDVDAIFAAALGPPRRPAFSITGNESALAPVAPSSKAAAADKSKDKGKGKGREKSVQRDKGKRKEGDGGDEEDDESFKKLCHDDITMALSSRWIPLKQIREIAAEHNFKYRQGKFTLAEDKIINTTLEDYRKMHHLTHAELKDCILRDRKGKRKEDKNQIGDDLWPTIAMAVGGGRPVLAVYNHVKRQYDPSVKGGPWTVSEDQALEAAVKEHGTAWTKISAHVGRNPTDCRDRYTKHVNPAVAGKRKVGKWEPAEEEKLRGLVKLHGNNWKTMEKLMDGRTATQCRNKWRDSLAPSEAIKAEAPSEDDEEKPGSSRRWTRADRSTLVHAIADLKVNHVSEIDWDDVGDAHLQRHGSKNLRDRWRRLTMKAQAQLGKERDDELDHAQVIAYQLQCYPVRGSSAVARKPAKDGAKKIRASPYKSARFIEGSEEEEGASSSEDEESD